jgi:hypothetical protein
VVSGANLANSNSVYGWQPNLGRIYSSFGLPTLEYFVDLLDQVPFDRLPEYLLLLVMTRGIGANLTNDEKRAHLIDLRREHLIDQVCSQEILLPEK